MPKGGGGSLDSVAQADARTVEQRCGSRGNRSPVRLGEALTNDEGSGKPEISAGRYQQASHKLAFSFVPSRMTIAASGSGDDAIRHFRRSLLQSSVVRATAPLEPLMCQADAREIPQGAQERAHGRRVVTTQSGPPQR